MQRPQQQYKLYVPDHDKFYRYYKLTASGKVDPHIAVMRGGQKTSMMSMDRILDLYDPEWRKQKPEEKCSNEPKINFVSPTEQVVQQAKALQKLERENQRDVNRPRKKQKVL